MTSCAADGKAIAFGLLLVAIALVECSPALGQTVPLYGTSPSLPAPPAPPAVAARSCTLKAETPVVGQRLVSMPSDTIGFEVLVTRSGLWRLVAVDTATSRTCTLAAGNRAVVRLPVMHAEGRVE